MKNDRRLSSLELRFVGAAEDPFSRALKRQMKLHESVTLPDLVKFLYQSSLGSFHLLENIDEKELLNWIRRSLDKTQASAGPLVESLYGRKWVRINFGPYKEKYGNDYQRIYRAFMKVKNVKQGEREEFRKLLRNLIEAFRKGQIQSVAQEPRISRLAEDFLKEYERGNFPSIHHSKSYRQKNSSDYLVIPRSSLAEITGRKKSEMKRQSRAHGVSKRKCFSFSSHFHSTLLC